MAKVEHGSLVAKDEFILVLAGYAKHFGYEAFSAARDVTRHSDYILPNVESPVRFLTLKEHWYPSELMVFDGDDFCHAAARSLRRRPPSQDELDWLSAKKKVWSRMELLLRLDGENRAEGGGIKLHGVGLCRSFWEISKWLGGRKLRVPAKIAQGCFRSLAKRQMRRMIEDVSMRQLLLATLDRLDSFTRGKGPA